MNVSTKLAIVFLACALTACNLPGLESAPISVTVTPLVVPTRAVSEAKPVAAPSETLIVIPTATSVPSSPTTVASPSPTLTSLPAKQSVPAGWLAYRNQEYRFELNYPEQGILVEDQTTHARIDLPYAPGTNLQEKYLEIDIQGGDEPCTSPLASGYSSEALEREHVQVGDTVFEQQSSSEGAAGNFYEWTSYSTARQDVCVSLTFVLHSLDPYNFETPLAEYDTQSEAAIFSEIAASYQWLP